MSGISLNVWLPHCPLLEQLSALRPEQRTAELDCVLSAGLAEVLRTGLRRIGGESGGQLRVRITPARYPEVIAVAGALGITPRRVVREVILAVDETLDRKYLETAFRRLRLQGDPTRLSVPILRLFVENPKTEDPVMLAVRSLVETVTILQKKVDVLSSRVESRDVTAAELLKMSPVELRERLRRLGGRAPRNASRGELLSLIREKENEL